MTRYQATLSRDKGRKEWCVIFRHPIMPDRSGRPGLRVRRSLKTDDKDRAQGLVDKLNEILADETLWTIASREVVSRRGYNHLIVAAFYDQLTATTRDSWEARNEIIPLPKRSDGYKRILLMGTTGSGKSTLVQQFVGTNPRSERFPATSPNRTTTCNIEGIIADGAYRAVITFLSKDEVRQLVEENVLAACEAAQVDATRPEEAARKLLGHRDLRFRLNFILGRWRMSNTNTVLVDDDDEVPESECAEFLTNEERESHSERLRYYLGRIGALCNSVSEELSKNGASTGSTETISSSQTVDDSLEEQFEELLPNQTDFQLLVDDIVDDIESRFDSLNNVDYERGKDGWPWRAIIETDDRDEFIQSINCFSDNLESHWGRLLTPVVDGIRFAGPFKPTWWEGTDSPRWIFLDGEGLGHQSTTSSSVPTNITRRFKDSDVILLVDTAKTPMQASSLAAMRTVVANGYDSKLVICFTHCDALRSDSLPDPELQRNHVLAALDQVVGAIGKELGREAEVALTAVSSERVYFVAKIQSALSPKARATRAEFLKMIEAFDKVSAPIPHGEIRLTYSDANVIVGIQKALENFHKHWRARLGLEYRLDVRNEHWTRIRALSKRVAHSGEDHYDNLQPVADLMARLSEQFSPILDNPIRHEPETIGDDQRHLAISLIKNEVSDRLHTLIPKHVIYDRLKFWNDAFAYSGRGSGRRRSESIRGIFTSAAPIPGVDIGWAENELIRELQALVRNAVRVSGGRFVNDE